MKKFQVRYGFDFTGRPGGDWQDVGRPRDTREAAEKHLKNRAKHFGHGRDLYKVFEVEVERCSS